MTHIIHLHDTSNSSIDKYWVYMSWEETEVKLRSLLEEYMPYIDHAYYRELYDLEYELENKDSEEEEGEEEKMSYEEFIAGIKAGPDKIYVFKDDVYIVCSKIDSYNYGSRP